jgi:hypothetical protein
VRRIKRAITAVFLAALMAVLLVAMTACGADTTLSGFIGAVKSANIDKANEYIDGSVKLSEPYDDDDEVAAYAYKKTVGSFTYKVVSVDYKMVTESDSDSDDVDTATIEISYSAYSYTELYLQMGWSTSIGDLVSGTKKTKADVDAALAKMSKVEGSTTVKLSENKDNKWKIASADAQALVLVMTTPVSK